eukprot:gene3069-5239_t
MNNIKNYKIPKISFGAATLGDEYGQVDKKEGVEAVKRALELGITLFDTSPYYGRKKSEQALGDALQQASKELHLNRSDYFICTKTGRYDVSEFDFSKKRIEKSIQESLNRLQTDYLDILILHDVEFGDEKLIIEESIPTLLSYKEKGTINNVGISGYPLDKLLSIVEKVNKTEKKIDLVLSYCHFTLQNNLLQEYSEKFKKFNVTLMSASPLSMRLLTDIGPPEWHPASKEIKESCERVNEYCKKNDLNISKIAIQYSLKFNDFSKTTLIGFSSQQEVEQSIKWLNEELDEDHLEEILKILKNVHNETWKSGI